MKSLATNKELYFYIKEKVLNRDNKIMDHILINELQNKQKIVSIVMTSSNRIAQTYYTLETIKSSSYPNVQVILVEDSDKEILDIEKLKSYGLHIDLIKIKRENKIWINPVVNYNIGFNFIIGDYIIIQNAEVCHLGDVINFIVSNIQNNQYYVFDVKPIKNFESNEIIYNLKPSDNSIYLREELFMGWWYQHKSLNRNLHFLTALTKNTFDVIKEFSYDYTLTIDYDDNDFVLKIISNKINILNVDNDEYKIGGIHLFHESAQTAWSKNFESNGDLYKRKVKYFLNNGEYIDVTKNYNDYESNYKKLLV